MPTYNRRAFVPRAVAQFLEQDYAGPRELIVVDDGTDSIGDLLPADERVRYIRPPHRLTIGAKRNIACEAARGEYVAWWDDDDWMASWRLSYQMGALVHSGADICGLQRLYIHEPSSGRQWEFIHAGVIRGTGWLAGGTLVYKRTLWEKVRFEDTNDGEDIRFLRGAVRTKAKKIVLTDSRFYIVEIHRNNTITRRPEVDRVMIVDGVPVRLWKEHDAAALALWKASRGPHRALPVAQAPPTPESAPLVSCIMPTFNRRSFIPRAISQFLEQTYPEKELIIVDDGADDISDLVPDDDRIRLLRLPFRHSIGAKRNIACEAAKGEFVAHSDDDDWQAPRRLRVQMDALLRADADVCGLENVYFHEPSTGCVWEFVTPGFSRGRGWLAGQGLCYRKALWREHHFLDLNDGEDAAFVAAFKGKTKVLVLDDPGIYVVEIHPGNSATPRPDVEEALTVGLGAERVSCHLWEERDEAFLERVKEGPVSASRLLVEEAACA